MLYSILSLLSVAFDISYAAGGYEVTVDVVQKEVGEEPVQVVGAGKDRLTFSYATSSYVIDYSKNASTPSKTPLPPGEDVFLYRGFANGTDAVKRIVSRQEGEVFTWSSFAGAMRPTLDNCTGKIVAAVDGVVVVACGSKWFVAEGSNHFEIIKPRPFSEEGVQIARFDGGQPHVIIAASFVNDTESVGIEVPCVYFFLVALSVGPTSGYVSHSESACSSLRFLTLGEDPDELVSKAFIPTSLSIRLVGSPMMGPKVHTIAQVSIGVGAVAVCDERVCGGPLRQHTIAYKNSWPNAKARLGYARGALLFSLEGHNMATRVVFGGAVVSKFAQFSDEPCESAFAGTNCTGARRGVGAALVSLSSTSSEGGLLLFDGCHLLFNSTGIPLTTGAALTQPSVFERGSIASGCYRNGTLHFFHMTGELFMEIGVATVDTDYFGSGVFSIEKYGTHMAPEVLVWGFGTKGLTSLKVSFSAGDGLSLAKAAGRTPTTLRQRGPVAVGATCIAVGDPVACRVDIIRGNGGRDGFASGDLVFSDSLPLSPCRLGDVNVVSLAVTDDCRYVYAVIASIAADSGNTTDSIVLVASFRETISSRAFVQLSNVHLGHASWMGGVPLVPSDGFAGSPFQVRPDGWDGGSLVGFGYGHWVSQSFGDTASRADAGAILRQQRVAILRSGVGEDVATKVCAVAGQPWYTTFAAFAEGRISGAEKASNGGDVSNRIGPPSPGVHSPAAAPTSSVAAENDGFDAAGGVLSGISYGPASAEGFSWDAARGRVAAVASNSSASNATPGGRMVVMCVSIPSFFPATAGYNGEDRTLPTTHPSVSTASIVYDTDVPSKVGSVPEPAIMFGSSVAVSRPFEVKEGLFAQRVAIAGTSAVYVLEVHVHEHFGLLGQVRVPRPWPLGGWRPESSIFHGPVVPPSVSLTPTMLAVGYSDDGSCSCGRVVRPAAVSWCGGSGAVVQFSLPVGERNDKGHPLAMTPTPITVTKLPCENTHGDICERIGCNVQKAGFGTAVMLTDSGVMAVVSQFRLGEASGGLASPTWFGNSSEAPVSAAGVGGVTWYSSDVVISTLSATASGGGYATGDGAMGSPTIIVAPLSETRWFGVVGQKLFTVDVAKPSNHSVVNSVNLAGLVSFEGGDRDLSCLSMFDRNGTASELAALGSGDGAWKGTVPRQQVSAAYPFVSTIATRGDMFRFVVASLAYNSDGGATKPHIFVFDAVVTDSRVSWLSRGVIVEGCTPSIRCGASLSVLGSRIVLGAPGGLTPGVLVAGGAVYIADLGGSLPLSSSSPITVPPASFCVVHPQGAHAGGFGWAVDIASYSDPAASSSDAVLAVGAPLGTPPQVQTFFLGGVKASFFQAVSCFMAVEGLCGWDASFLRQSESDNVVSGGAPNLLIVSSPVGLGGACGETFHSLQSVSIDWKGSPAGTSEKASVTLNNVHSIALAVASDGGAAAVVSTTPCGEDCAARLDYSRLEASANGVTASATTPRFNVSRSHVAYGGSVAVEIEGSEVAFGVSTCGKIDVGAVRHASSSFDSVGVLHSLAPPSSNMTSPLDCFGVGVGFVKEYGAEGAGAANYLLTVSSDYGVENPKSRFLLTRQPPPPRAATVTLTASMPAPATVSVSRPPRTVTLLASPPPPTPTVAVPPLSTPVASAIPEVSSYSLTPLSGVFEDRPTLSPVQLRPTLVPAATTVAVPTTPSIPVRTATPVTVHATITRTPSILAPPPPVTPPATPTIDKVPFGVVGGVTPPPHPAAVDDSTANVDFYEDLLRPETYRGPATSVAAGAAGAAGGAPAGGSVGVMSILIASPCLEEVGYDLVDSFAERLVGGVMAPLRDLLVGEVRMMNECVDVIVLFVFILGIGFVAEVVVVFKVVIARTVGHPLRVGRDKPWMAPKGAAFSVGVQHTADSFVSGAATLALMAAMSPLIAQVVTTAAISVATESYAKPRDVAVVLVTVSTTCLLVVLSLIPFFTTPLHDLTSREEGEADSRHPTSTRHAQLPPAVYDRSPYVYVRTTCPHALALGGRFRTPCGPLEVGCCPPAEECPQVKRSERVGKARLWRAPSRHAPLQAGLHSAPPACPFLMQRAAWGGFLLGRWQPRKARQTHYTTSTSGSGDAALRPWQSAITQVLSVIALHTSSPSVLPTASWFGALNLLMDVMVGVVSALKPPCPVFWAVVFVSFAFLVSTAIKIRPFAAVGDLEVFCTAMGSFVVVSVLGMLVHFGVPVGSLAQTAGLVGVGASVVLKVALTLNAAFRSSVVPAPLEGSQRGVRHVVLPTGVCVYDAIMALREYEVILVPKAQPTQDTAEKDKGVGGGDSVVPKPSPCDAVDHNNATAELRHGEWVVGGEAGSGQGGEQRALQSEQRAIVRASKPRSNSSPVLMRAAARPSGLPKKRRASRGSSGRGGGSGGSGRSSGTSGTPRGVEVLFGGSIESKAKPPGGRGDVVGGACPPPPSAPPSVGASTDAREGSATTSFVDAQLPPPHAAAGGSQSDPSPHGSHGDDSGDIEPERVGEPAATPLRRPFFPPVAPPGRWHSPLSFLKPTPAPPPLPPVPQPTAPAKSRWSTPLVVPPAAGTALQASQAAAPHPECPPTLPSQRSASPSRWKDHSTGGLTAVEATRALAASRDVRPQPRDVMPKGHAPLHRHAQSPAPPRAASAQAAAQHERRPLADGPVPHGTPAPHSPPRATANRLPPPQSSGRSSRTAQPSAVVIDDDSSDDGSAVPSQCAASAPPRAPQGSSPTTGSPSQQRGVPFEPATLFR